MAAKIGKRERKNKKNRTSDAPVIIVVARIFPFPFQRCALLRSRDPHNVVVLCCLLFIFVVIIVVVIMWSVLCLPNQNRLKKAKTEKKKF